MQRGEPRNASWSWQKHEVPVGHEHIPSLDIFFGTQGLSAQHWVQIDPEDARDADIMAVAEREDYII